MKFEFLLFFTLLFCFIFPRQVYGSANNNIYCDNRYLTIVNPVRGRELWKDKTLKPLADQYNLIKQHNFGATWLLQYDTFDDRELISALKSFDPKQEKGIFLEVSKNLAKRAQVVYPQDSLWYEPKAVFLSGYTQSDRKRLIDRLFNDFKAQFGVYPKSIGAWWIDSYSLDYLRQKYGVKIAMIVADQLTTDHYGVWGQWWGVPYFPAKSSILTPASNIANKENVVVIQWAQRHPVLAYGPDSSYSLQANDYIKLGKNINFFDQLVDIYLSCDNKVGQITIGLETGMESVDFIGEYSSQFEHLSRINNLSSLTMGEFAERFAAVYPGIVSNATIKYQDSVFIMNSESRSNLSFKEFIKYRPYVSFADYFLSDKSSFLDRKLLTEQTRIIDRSFEMWILLIIVFGLPLLFRNRLKLWITSLLFSYACFGLILKSGYQFGWIVFYGAKVEKLFYIQMGVILSVYAIFYFLNRYKKVNNLLWYLPLSFAIDPLIQLLRMSYLSGKYYFGLLHNKVDFLGVSFGKPFNFSFFRIEFDPLQAQSLLKVDFNKIWDNLWLFLLIYPLAHLLFGFIIFKFVSRVPLKVKNVIVFLLVLLLALHIKGIYSADPRYILPSN